MIEIPEERDLAAPKENIELAKLYLANIKREFETGRATEHTYRAALKGLIEALGRDVVAINEPKERLVVLLILSSEEIISLLDTSKQKSLGNL